jgi:hypothetical protein
MMHKMMDRIGIVQACLAAVEQSRFDEAERLIADDFEMLGPAPKPVHKQDWLGNHRSMNVAFPDYAFNATELEERDGKVFCRMRITGTHRGMLDLSSLGVPSLPATNRTFALPPQRVEWQFRGDQITRAIVENPPGGGFAGLLQQLGAQLPD